MRQLIRDIRLDLIATQRNKWGAVFGNRGFHALLVYRISHCLWKLKIPGIPSLLTRLIHILYAIEIDYHARIEGGVNIIHGFATVIGPAVIKSGATIFHGVTIGRNFSDKRPDGNPTIERNVFIGTGAKLLGPVRIGENTKIGANVVITKDVEAGSTVTQESVIRHIIDKSIRNSRMSG